MAIDLYVVAPSVLLVVIGVAAGVGQVRKLWLWTAIARATATDVGDAAPGDLRIQGRIVDVDAGGTYADTETDGALRAWRVAEYTSGLGHAHKTEGWEEASQGVEANPFVVADGTGRIRVEASPGHGGVVDWLVTDTFSDSGAWSGGVVAAFEDDFDDFPERRRNPSAGDRHRQSVTLDRGDDVSLYGTVVEDADGDRVLVAPGSFVPLVVADHDLAESRLVGKWPWYVGGALLAGTLAVGGVAGVLYGAGLF